MSNGFKKAVGLLVSASMLASLAATAFAGTAAAAITLVPTPVAVPGNAAYTALPGHVITLNGTDDIFAPYPGANMRFHVGNGFELNPAAPITVTVTTTGSGGLLFGNSGPGALSVAVSPVTTPSASYFDVPVWQSSGDCVTTNCVVTFSGGAVRQRAGSASSGAVVDINHNLTDPGDVVAIAFTIYTLTGGVGAEMPALNCSPYSITATALVPVPGPLPPVGSYTTCTATGSGLDWAGNAAAGFVPANSTITASGPGALGASPANPIAARNFWGQVVGTYTATVTSGAPTAGLTATDTFAIVAAPFAKIEVIPAGPGTLPIGGTIQFVAICRDQFDNEIARTGLDGFRPWNCFGTWSDSPHPGAAEVNFTGLLTGLRLGIVDAVTYTIGSISGSSGPWEVVSGPAAIVLGNAVPVSPFAQASPIVRAGGYGATTASYSYSEPELLPNWFPPFSGATLFGTYNNGNPLVGGWDGFVWTIDISDHQGNRRVHFDTSVAPTIVGPTSLDLSASFLNDYTLEVTASASNAAQVEGLSIQGLKVKADANAALGSIRTRYGLNTSRFTFGGNGGGTAVAVITPFAALPGTTAFAVADFLGVIMPTAGDVGPLNFTNLDIIQWALCDAFGTCPAFSESVNVVTATPPSILGVQVLTTTTRASGHAVGTVVTQDQGSLDSCEGILPNPAGIHNYGRCALPSIGTVVDSLKLTSNQPPVQRGLPNRLPFGTLGIEERTTGAEGNGTSSGLLAQGTVISLKLDPTQGVVFSEPPTARVTWTKAGAVGWLCDLAQTHEGCGGIDRGALTVPYFWISTTAHFGPTADGRGNFFINDDPYAFENRTAIFMTTDTFATVTPSTWHDHSAFTPVGQDVYGAALGDLGSGQAPLTLYNPRNAYPTLVDPLAYNNNVYVADLSPDRLTATFKVRTPDVGWVTSKLLVDGFIDVSAASAAGGSVDLTVETGAGAAAARVGAAASSIPVIPGSISIGIINNTVDGTAQAIPSVIIGANDQATGTVVIREAAAGMLGASFLTNVLRVCYVSQTGVPEVFTRAPWLVVANGDLKIRANSDPSIPSGAAAPGTGVRGYLGVGGTNCAQWIVFNGSTTKSTLEIRGSGTDGAMLASGPNNGPRVNVHPQQKPGPVTLSLWQMPLDWFSLGSIPASLTEFDLVQNAVRVYGANVAVAAVSQPEIRKGKLNQPAGDVTITESATYQLGAPTYLGFNQQAIWFQIVPNNARDVLPSVYFNTDRVVPVVSTNSAESGLIARFSRWWNNTTFTAITEQRAFVPVPSAWVPGKITVSGLQYSATNDAALGPVQLQVCSTGGLNVSSPSDFSVCPGIQTGLFLAAENPANFNQTVSNAKVVEDSSIIGAIAPGVAGPGTNKWTFNTVIVKKGKYVTLRLQAVKGAVVGDRIEIWGRTSKTGAWKKLTTRLVGANGYIFYFKKVSGYQEFQALFAGSDTAAASYAVPRYYRALGH